MFIFDVETLGKESNACILSMACIHFDPDSEPSLEDMKANAFFVKLDAKDQHKRLGRGYHNSTIDWWKKQCENVKVKSYYPRDDDIKLEDGIEMWRSWSKQFKDVDDGWVWARGNLDQLVMDSAFEQIGVDSVFFYTRWRDVRTAIDIFTNSQTGYCEVDYPGFDPELHITKHDPVDDCLYDAMMLMYGKKHNVS
jgi:hypothetical protein